MPELITQPAFLIAVVGIDLLFYKYLSRREIPGERDACGAGGPFLVKVDAGIIIFRTVFFPVRVEDV